jgi:Ca-activated chloride channel family protein
MIDIEFAYPWIFLLLPLPLLYWWLLPASAQEQAALRVPFFSRLREASTGFSVNRQQQSRKKFALLIVLWCGLVISASDPQWVGEPVTLPSSGRDLLLAVDISGSMREQDMRIQDEMVPRIIAVKAVLRDFIERRKGDRLGLILFGSQAYLQAPLTFDRSTVAQFMNEAQLGFAGPQTAIGDAIGLAIKRLRERPGDKHVVILLTDGANTAGSVTPLAAAKLAAENNITVYTIGVGADEMVVPGLFGSSFGARRVNPSADLDENTLQEIASLTNGQYFRAKDPEELVKIYQTLDALEPVDDEGVSFRPRQSLFFWPLGVALVITLLWPVLPFTNTLLRKSNVNNQSGIPLNGGESR